jgi:hypothetical protein
MPCPDSAIFCSTVALITINGPHILPSIACYITNSLQKVQVFPEVASKLQAKAKLYCLELKS